jgi:hypothetical protein
MDTLAATRRQDVWLCRIGGVCAIALGVLYILITALYVRGGALPSDAEERLRHLVDHTWTWWWILGLSVATDLLFLPILWALYGVLKDVDRNLMLAGTSLVALFVILDLALTWPNFSALITLSQSYAATGAEGERLAVLGAANYAVEVLSSALFGVYAILLPGIGILLIGVVMARGAFGKTAAVTAIATGVFGVIAVVGPLVVDVAEVAAVATAILTTLWVLLVGFTLLRRASRPASRYDQPAPTSGSLSS